MSVVFENLEKRGKLGARFGLFFFFQRSAEGGRVKLYFIQVCLNSWKSIAATNRSAKKNRLAPVWYYFLTSFLLSQGNRSVNREGAGCLGFREVIDSFMQRSKMCAREMWSG